MSLAGSMKKLKVICNKITKGIQKERGHVSAFFMPEAKCHPKCMNIRPDPENLIKENSQILVAKRILLP
jgi:hypothetical protein